jgi:hypothetical protein
MILLGVFSLVAVATASAAPNQVDLLKDANIRLAGGAAEENIGDRVSSVGDLNGDGLNDIAVSASSASPQGRTEAGSVFVIYGGTTPIGDLDLSDLGPNGFRIDGAIHHESIGWGLDGAGDVNNDGVDDLLISGPGTHDDGERLNIGAAWVVYGQDAEDPPDLDLADLETTAATRAFSVVGPKEEAQLGYSVAGAGDLNGDDVDDVVIGAPGIWSGISSGAVFVVYGESTADVPNLNLADLPTSAASRGYKISGDSRDGLGEKLAVAGDFNDDGTNDLVLGSPYASNEGAFGMNSHGGAYVIYGADVADPPDLLLANISTSAASRGMRMRGDSNASSIDCCGSLTGWTVAGEVDANDDGVDDVVVGAVNTDFNERANSGSIYVVYGQSAADPGDLDLAEIEGGSAGRGMRLDGEAANDRVGQSAAAAGDINSDGVDDLVFGATGTDNNGRAESGSAYVVYGEDDADPPDLDLTVLNADVSRGFRIDGAAAGDMAGHRVAGVGDLTADGVDDVLIGAPHYSFAGGGDGPGAAFIPQRISKPSPRLTFGPQLVGTESATQTASLAQMSGGGIEVEEVDLAGASPGQFEIVLDSCSGEQLQVGESCIVSVRFRPTGAGETKHAVLRFLDNASNAPQEVQLQGDAIPDPLAADDLATIDEDPDAPAPIDVLANDSDLQDEPITIISATQPGHGAVTLIGGVPGARTGLAYAPDANYCNDSPGTAPDTFSYTVNGGDFATVSVRVSCVDDPPAAVPETILLSEDSPAVTVPVLANDTDIDGGPRSIASASDPEHGTVVLTGGAPGFHTALTYQPDPGYCNNPPDIAEDTFTYTLSFGGSTATVSARVNCVDDNPVPLADTAVIGEDSGAIEIDVLANDLNGDAGPRAITAVSDAGGGRAAIADDGLSVTYTPNPDYCNDAPGKLPDSFVYVVNDAASAPVSVTVTCRDDAPGAASDSVAVDENRSLTINVLANDFDIDGGPKLVQGATQATHGSVSVAAAGSAEYQPQRGYCGPDRFSYALNGGSSAEVTIDVRCDSTTPQTHLVLRPKQTIRKRGKWATVRFRFVSNEPGRFECRIDRAPFAPCSSPTKFRLPRGAHRFEARAIDLADNVDPTSATALFRILGQVRR